MCCDWGRTHIAVERNCASIRSGEIIDDIVPNLRTALSKRTVGHVLARTRRSASVTADYSTRLDARK